MHAIRAVGGACAIMSLLALGSCGGASPGNSGTPASIPDTSVPAILISLPTASGSYATANASVALAGTASDNVGVTSVTWSNATNGTSGTATGTTSWSASVALALGANAIRVTAHDAAGNTRNAALTVTYNPAGGTSLSGSVDSSLINRSGLNAVYIYSGTVTPDDIGGTGAQPLTTAPVTQDNNACTFGYQVSGLAAGTYTVAFTNLAANDVAGDQAITFLGTTQVTIPGGGGAIQNFAPVRRLQVGPTRTGLNTFTVPSAAITAAQSGDVIEIDPVDYVDDNAVLTTSNVTLRGVGGARPHLRSTQLIGNGKGIWVNDAQNTTVENIEFSGATVTDQNGAGIRNEANGLTVCNGFFHDNENGILGGVGTLLIEYSEFNHNGRGDGFTHNMYIDGGTLFTLRYSYSHRAVIGHNVKSRAQETRILYNRIMDEADGTGSYAIDIPQVGRTYIIGNIIQQGPNTDNSNIIAYGAESATNVVQELYVVNNTIVNDLHSGLFLDIRAGTTARIVNNIFAGGGTKPTASGSVTLTTNLTADVTSSAGLVNAAGFDYHLTAASPARDVGTDPAGITAPISLTPTSQYLYDINREDRPVNGTIDIGAYEF